jgi:hypothetical protein
MVPGNHTWCCAAPHIPARGPDTAHKDHTHMQAPRRSRLAGAPCVHRATRCMCCTLHGRWLHSHHATLLYTPDHHTHTETNASLEQKHAPLSPTAPTLFVTAPHNLIALNLSYARTRAHTRTHTHMHACMHTHTRRCHHRVRHCLVPCCAHTWYTAQQRARHDCCLHRQHAEQTLWCVRACAPRRPPGHIAPPDRCNVCAAAITAPQAPSCLGAREQHTP